MTDGFDIDAPGHEKAKRMLQTDLIAWFTTVAPDGKPHAVPVWFFWHEGQVLVFSEDKTVKVRHVRGGSPVLVHLDTGGAFGDDVVILEGSATVSGDDATTWLPRIREPYEAKYAEAIADFGVGLDDIAARFPTVLVFTPERALTW
jgi:PPOX class probable F420-dependent enzyme